MLWLIKKELTANVKYLVIGFVIFLVYAFIFSSNGVGLFTLCLTICVYSISATNLAIDERYHIYRRLTTLPVRRRDVVLSKFLLIDVMFAVCLALYALLFLATNALGIGRIPPVSFSAAMLGLFTASVYSGVTIPLNYRFGAQSTRYVAMGLFFVVFALSPLLPKGATLATGAGFSDGLTGGLCLLGAAAVQTGSFFLSNALFAKKDL